jgi:hypothetical protein
LGGFEGPNGDCHFEDCSDVGQEYGGNLVSDRKPWEGEGKVPQVCGECARKPEFESIDKQGLSPIDAVASFSVIEDADAEEDLKLSVRRRTTGLISGFDSATVTVKRISTVGLTSNDPIPRTSATIGGRMPACQLA